jgi:hypothetical protein
LLEAIDWRRTVVPALPARPTAVGCALNPAIFLSPSRLRSGRGSHAVGNRLPSDPEALRALAISLQAPLATKDPELAARDAELHANTLHIEKLRATLALMRQARFGRSSERIDQLELFIGDL